MKSKIKDKLKIRDLDAREGHDKLENQKKSDAIEIERIRLIANETRNPLYIWMAIHYCSVNNIELPKFCLNYLFSSALRINKIMSLSAFPIMEGRMPSNTAVKKFTKTLLFINQGDRNPFSRFATDEDDIRAAMMSRFVETAPKSLLERLPMKTQADVIKAIRTLHSLEHNRSAIRKIDQGKKLRSL